MQQKAQKAQDTNDGRKGKKKGKATPPEQRGSYYKTHKQEESHGGGGKGGQKEKVEQAQSIGPLERAQKGGLQSAGKKTPKAKKRKNLKCAEKKRAPPDLSQKHKGIDH